jgi:hypothetical protein
MHGFRMTEDKTRRELRGPFWSDYFKSVRGVSGWDDGGKQFTNYVAHPAEGAVFAHIWVNNSPAAKQARFGANGPYAITRLQALSWAVFWSTMFEIGPVSEASLGNVGSTLGRQGYVDLVMTPVVGTAEAVAEDALDLYVVRWVERRTGNGNWRALTRVLLNPSRTFSNVLRFKVPWYRDDRPLRQR